MNVGKPPPEPDIRPTLWGLVAFLIVLVAMIIYVGRALGWWGDSPFQP